MSKLVTILFQQNKKEYVHTLLFWLALAITVILGIESTIKLLT